MATGRPFEYKNITVISVRDGDTITLEIDIGFGLRFKDKFRLYKIDTFELKEAGGQEAKSYTVQWLEDHKETLVVQSFKKGSFGRWLCEIRCDDCGESLNAKLLSEGHAVVYKR